MDHCAKHPLKLLLPDPARGPRRSGHAAIVPYYGCRIFHFETRLHGCRGRTLDRGGPGAALPGLQTVCLSVRSNQKLDVGSPRQLANRAGCNVRRRSTKPLDPNQRIDGTEPLAGPKPRRWRRLCPATVRSRHPNLLSRLGGDGIFHDRLEPISDSWTAAKCPIRSSRRRAPTTSGERRYLALLRF